MGDAYIWISELFDRDTNTDTDTGADTEKRTHAHTNNIRFAPEITLTYSVPLPHRSRVSKPGLFLTFSEHSSPHV